MPLRALFGRMTFLTLLRPRPFSLFAANLFSAVSVLKYPCIIHLTYSNRYSFHIDMASTHSEPEQNSTGLSCSLKVQWSSEDTSNWCGTEAESVESNHNGGMQRIIWGNRNPTLSTGSNPPIQWPQNLTHRIPNIRDLVAVDASEIVEPVLEDEAKLQNGEKPVSPVQDGQPSKRSVKKAAQNERRKAIRKVAKQRDRAGQRPVRESRAHEDGLPTCLSSSSDDDLIPGQPPDQTESQTPKKDPRTISPKSPNDYETDRTLSESHKQRISTQAGSSNTGDIAICIETLPEMESSNHSEASNPHTANETTPALAPPNQNQPQVQQRKEKKPKALKPPSTPAALPLSPALIDLRVGHILRCIPHENADSLYVSTIAMGDPEGTENTHKDEETGRIVRTVCSGLRGLITLEQMQDRKVIVMANLKPVTMRGIKSAAMVLAASPPPKEGEDPHSANKVVELVSPPEGSEAGARVYFEGWEYGEGRGPEKVLNPKKKQWEGVQPGLYTSEDLTVVFDAGRVEGVEGGQGELVVEGGKAKCKVPTLKGARLS